MSILEYIIGGLLLVLAVVLVWIIGAQQSKRKSGLGNSIAGNGASETYLSRNKIASKESSYKKVTLILAIVFIVLVLALYIVGSIDESDDTSSSADLSVDASAGITVLSQEDSSEAVAESSEAAVESSEAAVESSEAAE